MAVTPVTCLACGQRVDDTREVCPHCETELVASSPSTTSPPSSPLTGIWDRVRDGFSDRLSDLKEQSADQLPGLLAFLQTEDLRQWLDAVYEGTRTQYDRAMDAAFVAKQRAGELGYSAGQHRLFDEGHTVAGSFERAQQAVQGDAELTEIVEWSRSYLNDLTTPAGMPLVNLDPGDYQQWVDAFSVDVPGLQEHHLFDLLTFDAMELIAAELGVLGVLFALTDDDLERLSEVIGAMGMTAVVAANPILGMITIATTAYAYWRHEKVTGRSATKGGAIAGVSAVIFLTLGLPVLVELVVAIVVGYQLRKRLFESDEFVQWVKRNLRERPPKLDELASILPDRAPLARQVRAYLGAE